MLQAILPTIFGNTCTAAILLAYKAWKKTLKKNKTSLPNIPGAYSSTCLKKMFGML
jgi:hypothetical protein